ncbi:MAG: MurR/RpiR family transcriptional regulator [Granulosicoccus sp.]
MNEHLSHRILEVYDELSRSERKLADLLLENPDILVLKSSTELSEASDISRATTTRFFKRIGYTSFRAAQKIVRSGTETQSVSTKRTNPKWAGHRSLADHLQNDVQNLVRSIEAVRPDELADAALHLARADKIWVVGFGENYPLAHFARALLIRIKPDIRMIPIGGFSVPEEFSSIGPIDTMILLSVGRKSRSLQAIMRAGALHGAKLIYLTDQASRGGPDASSVTIRCRTSGTAIYESFAAPISLITYLCGMVAERLGQTAIERLQLIEDLHADWGDNLSNDT